MNEYNRVIMLNVCFATKNWGRECWCLVKCAINVIVELKYRNVHVFSLLASVHS